jgi:hypothetical protein
MLSGAIPPMRSSALTLALLAAIALPGCKNDKAPAGTEGTAPLGAPSAPPKAPPTPKKGPIPEGFPQGNPRSLGPPLQVMPGQGIGPIRFGATFDTVARHMQHPCDERTETRCLYIDQAVDFTMKDGVVDGIYVVRRDRPAPPRADGQPRYFGTYFGGMLPDIALGVHKHIIEEELHPPERIEKLPAPDANGTVERHYYDGVVLEFDKLPNGNTVLGAMRILPSKTAKNPFKKPSTSDKLGLPPPSTPKVPPASTGKLDPLQPKAPAQPKE